MAAYSGAMADTEKFSAVEAMLREQIERLSKDNNDLRAQLRRVQEDEEYIANHDLLNELRKDGAEINQLRALLQSVYSELREWADPE